MARTSLVDEDMEDSILQEDAVLQESNQSAQTEPTPQAEMILHLLRLEVFQRWYLDVTQGFLRTSLMAPTVDEREEARRMYLSVEAMRDILDQAARDTQPVQPKNSRASH